MTFGKIVYDGTSQIFSLGDSMIVQCIYSLSDLTAAVVSPGLSLFILSGYIFKSDFLVRNSRAARYLLSVIVVGSGPLVNFKENWGRPRPRDIVEFGGEQAYQPPLQPTIAAQGGRSSVSGHASVGFFFFDIALLMRCCHWHWGTIGLCRIVQGGTSQAM